MFFGLFFGVTELIKRYSIKGISRQLDLLVLTVAFNYAKNMIRKMRFIFRGRTYVLVGTKYAHALNESALSNSRITDSLCHTI